MSIRKRHTGSGVRYDVRLRDPVGRMYERTFRTKRQAETYQAQELADRSRGAWLDPRRSATPFRDVSAYWLSSNPGKRPTGWARDETIVRVHLDPVIGSRPVASLTARDVQGLINTWSERLAPRTVRRQYGVVRAILNAAVSADLLARTPCRDIKLPALNQRLPHIVTAGELAALALAMGPEYQPMPYLGAVLGLRWGECAGLRVGRVDFLRSTVSVAEQLSRGPHGVMVKCPPKSEAGRRTMTAPPALMEMLTAHLARHAWTAEHAEQYLFVAPGGGPLDYSDWRRRVWLPACRTAGLEGLGFHDLRRANATGMVARGVDLKTAQARLGHSDPRLTLAVYAQATNDGDRAAADEMGAHFMPFLPANSLATVADVG